MRAAGGSSGPRPDAAVAAERRYLERLRRRVAWQASAAARLRGAAARAGREDGQILPLLAVGLLAVLLGICALVLDVGRAYVLERRLQATADAAALAAAGALPAAADAVAAAVAFGPAGKNPVPGADVTQTATPVCLRGIDYCYGGAPGAPRAGYANGVVVTEEATLRTQLARVLGIGSVTVRARATACGLCGARPLDVALVLDRTGSMGDDMQALRQGVETFLQALDPQLDWVSLLVLPPAPGGDACAAPPSSSAFPLAPGDSYPLGSDGSYVVVHLAHDYRNADGSLNAGSRLVRAVGCLRAGGSTSYRQALVAAQTELAEHGSGREGVQRVIVFESDGAANEAPDSAYDPDASTASVSGDTVYQARAERRDEVLRPCGSAVDYAGSIEPDGAGDGTVVFTVAYAVDRDDGCFQAPHAYTVVVRGRTRTRAVGYRAAPEGMSATEALRLIASPGDAVSQADTGDMRASFAAVAAKALGASLVPDDRAP